MPVVLVLIGSDLEMMQRLTVDSAPLYQRPTHELLVPPLGPLEVARLTGRTGADALDAYLVTGGFPKIVRLWSGGNLGAFLKRASPIPGQNSCSAPRGSTTRSYPPMSMHARSSIEPLTREALARLSMAGDATLRGARAVRAFWTRDNKVEVDLVGADREPPPPAPVAFVGTIKWRDRAPLTGSDIAALIRSAAGISRVDAATVLVAVRFVSQARLY